MARQLPIADMPQNPRRGHSCGSHSGPGAKNCCGGKDLGPLGDHEEISSEDMERFSGATRVCPECKTEVYDEAEMCHNCGHAFSSSHGDKGLPTWAIGAVVLLVLAFAIGMLAI